MQKSIVARQGPVALFGKAKTAKKVATTTKKAAPARKSSSSGKWHVLFHRSSRADQIDWHEFIRFCVA
jgi:hypothetical protein